MSKVWMILYLILMRVDIRKINLHNSIFLNCKSLLSLGCKQTKFFFFDADQMKLQSTCIPCWGNFIKNRNTFSAQVFDQGCVILSLHALLRPISHYTKFNKFLGFCINFFCIFASFCNQSKYCKNMWKRENPKKWHIWV